MWNPSTALGQWIGKNIVQGGNNPYWNWYDFLLPGSSAINTLTDAKGTQAAQAQFQNQLYLDNSARTYNSQEAQKQRDWEQMMSNTSVQRAMADIKAAGLNPWLALQNVNGLTASTPSGSAASGSSGSASQANNKLVMAAGLIATALRMFLTKGK